MKRGKEQAAATRERILDEAARLFRERGFDGVSVAELMKTAGLTHGGFYGHFRSKEDLMVQACRRAVETMLRDWERVAGKGTGGLKRLTKFYLSPAHRDRPGVGCLMAAIGSEAARQATPVRDAVTEALGEVLAFLMRIAPARTAAGKRKQAIATFASLVGALVTARAVNDARLSSEVMKVTLAAVDERA